MLPLMLTVLNSTPYYNSLLRTVSVRGNIPSLGFREPGCCLVKVRDVKIIEATLHALESGSLRLLL